MHRLTALLLALVVLLLWPIGMVPAAQANPCDPMLARRLLVAGGGGSFTVPLAYPPTDASWTRSASNPIMSAGGGWEGSTHLLEPCVLYESGTWKMWYSANNGIGSAATGYATCTGDPTNGANWTKYAGNPVIAATAAQPFVTKIGSTYHVWHTDGTNILHRTSADGISWSASTTAITPGALSGSATNCYNPFVWQESPTDWRMMFEATGSGFGSWYDRVGYATSADGINWTIGLSGLWYSSLLIIPAASGGGSMSAWVIKKGNVFHCWYHANALAAGLPQDIYHATTTDPATDTWTISPATPVLTHLGSGTWEYDQAADPDVIVVGSTAYLFYDGDNNTTNEAGPWAKIGVATAPAVP